MKAISTILAVATFVVPNRVYTYYLLVWRKVNFVGLLH